MNTIQFAVNDIACTSCIVKIKKGIQRMNGVKEARVVAGSGRLQILFNEQLVRQEEILHHAHQLAFRTFD